MLLALLLAAALDVSEVTNAQYRACVEAKACRPAAFEDPRSASNLKTGKSENAATYREVAGYDQPAVGVSWDDARAYCAWKGQELPSARDWPKGVKPAVASWLADRAGKKRAVRGKDGRRSSEEPSARAHWLGFRCATR
jgi:formylglycine-generating enzyme required for sulfatase activity